MAKYTFIGDANGVGAVRFFGRGEDGEMLKVGESVELTDEQIRNMAPSTRKQFFSAEKQAEVAKKKAAAAQARVEQIKKEAEEARERVIAEAVAQAEKAQADALAAAERLAEQAQAEADELTPAQKAPPPPKSKRGPGRPKKE